MIYGILLTLFVINCFALILLVLIQKGKGSMGLGSMGGGTTMLFGGSGGQDFFQKLTWVLGGTLMAGSLILGLVKSSYLHNVKYINIQEQAVPAKDALELPDGTQATTQPNEQKSQEATPQQTASSKPASGNTEAKQPLAAQPKEAKPDETKKPLASKAS
jgi:preprotein translocase subunit SecG